MVIRPVIIYLPYPITRLQRIIKGTAAINPKGQYTASIRIEATLNIIDAMK